VAVLDNPESQTFRSEKVAMGTDATALVEAKPANRWIAMTMPIWPNPGFTERGEEPLAPLPGIARHYGLFSVLADVRNRTGRGYKVTATAVVPDVGPVQYEYDTDDGGHDPLQFIDVPRGTPKDALPAWRALTRLDKYHDATWFTLTELENAPYDQVLYEQAVAYESEYLRWKETGEPPEMHARSVGGPGMRVVNEVEYAAGLRGPEQTAIDFRWKGRTVREDAPQSWWATLAMMKLIAPDGDTDRVRMLMAFDS
jgi:hypothetical protein